MQILDALSNTNTKAPSKFKYKYFKYELFKNLRTKLKIFSYRKTMSKISVMISVSKAKSFSYLLVTPISSDCLKHVSDMT